MTETKSSDIPWTWVIWATCSAGLLTTYPSDLMCLAALGLLFLTQWLEPISWPAFRWFVLLWVGFWANCYWEKEMFAFDALRIPAFAWVAGLAILPSLRIPDIEHRIMDVLLLGGLFTLNLLVSWSPEISLQKHALLGGTLIGLIAAAEQSSLQSLCTSISRLWWVTIVQLVVAWALHPNVVWLESDCLRFQGFLSNPNSLSHPLLLLGITSVWANRNDHRLAAIFWVVTAFFLFLTGTRAALLAFGVFTIAFGWRHLQMLFSIRKMILVVFVGSIIVLILLDLAGWHWLRIESLIIGGGRFNAWPLATEHLLETPWWGRGAGYEFHWFFSMEPYFEWLNHIGNSHNTFMALAMDFGIVGGGALLSWIAFRFDWFSKETAWIFSAPLMIELMFENWLSAPLSASFLIMSASSFLVSKSLQIEGDLRADQKSTR